MKVSSLPTLLCMISLSFPVKAQFCNYAYYPVPTVNTVAMTLPVTSTNNPPIPVVSGHSVQLSLTFQQLGGPTLSNPIGSLYYTLDDVPFGPLIDSTTNQTFSFSWDTQPPPPAHPVPDGTHVLSVKYASQPSQTCQYGRAEFPIVVKNGTGFIQGAQAIPVETRASTPISTSSNTPSPAFDYIYYQNPNTRLHNIANPYPYVPIGSQNGADFQQPPTASNFFVEPLTQNPSDFAEATADLYQLPYNNNIPPVNPFAQALFYPEVGATIELGYDRVPYKNYWDGPRNDNAVDPYSNCVSTLDPITGPSSPAFYCIGLEGRLFSLQLGGSVSTIAGLRTIYSAIPYYYEYSNSPNPMWPSQEMVGTFDAFFQGSVDLTIDPRNHRIFYVADTKNNRIAKVDTTGGSPVITTYAGVTGPNGDYRDGPTHNCIPTSTCALFNEPYSLVMEGDGTMYVADKSNNVIRKITSDGSTVSTLVGIGYPNSPTQEPSTTIVANCPVYVPVTCPTGYAGQYQGVPVPFSQAYINYPYVIRLNSAGNLVEGEPATMTIRVIDLAAQTVTYIQQIMSKGDPLLSWIWLDVDTAGSIGPVDDVVFTKANCSGAACAFKIQKTGSAGTSPKKFPLGTCNTGGGSSPIHFGESACVKNPFGHYSWMVAISKQQGRVVFMGYGSMGVFSFHILQQLPPADPAWSYFPTNYQNGNNIWLSGTIPNFFPWGARPGFNVIHGYQGYSHLGVPAGCLPGTCSGVFNSDDMATMPDSDFCVAVAQPGTLGAYLQGGAGGHVARPELTGNDLRDLVYYVRRNSLSGGVTAMAVPYTPNCPGTTPTIGTVNVSPSPGQATITWSTTSVAALGLVQYGTVAGQYIAWSTIESSYNVNHSVQLTNLPAAGTVVYYQVLSKDVAGSQATYTGSFTAQ